MHSKELSGKQKLFTLNIPGYCALSFSNPTMYPALRTVVFLLLQALSESPDNIKNGSVAFVQAHCPTMNGEGTYWVACLYLFCHEAERGLYWSSSKYWCMVSN